MRATGPHANMACAGQAPALDASLSYRSSVHDQRWGPPVRAVSGPLLARRDFRLYYTPRLWRVDEAAIPA
jgi:hypothetical protein